MKKLLLALGLVVALAAPAGADTRFHATIRVTTPKAGATVRVHWKAQCLDDGVVSRGTGWYRTKTPDKRAIPLPDLSADSCSVYAHVWNLTGQGLPRLTIRVTP